MYAEDMIIISVLVGWILAGFLASRIFRRNDLADVFWGLGFLALAAAGLVQFGGGFSLQQVPLRTRILLALLIVWGVRLSIHIGLRNLGKGEDVRYLTWRKQWGSSEPVFAFLQIFTLQGLILLSVSTPVLFVLGSVPAPIGPFDFLALATCILGLAIEVSADWELRRHKQTASKGKLLQDGLWARSRHPNYFGETLFWFGMFFFCLSFADPRKWFALLSPLLMTYLLTRVSGVPMLEKFMKGKSPEFGRYAASVSAFLPFKLSDVARFLVICGVTLVLDLTWLGWLMKDFYSTQSVEVARISLTGGFDAVFWAALGVYFAIPLGLLVFAVRPGNPAQSLFRGLVFGLITYAIYDLTNLALIKNWPIEMSLVDLLWGPILCGGASVVGSYVGRSG